MTPKARTRKRPVAMPALSAREIGARIRRVRRESGIGSMADLAQIARIPYGTLSAYESGHRVPMRDQAIRLSLNLNRSLDFLMKCKGERGQWTNG